MKAAAFDYTRAESLDDVLDLLRREGDEARVIAGGQSLVAMMAMRLARPTHLIDINHVDALAGVAPVGHHVIIKACTRQTAAMASDSVRRDAPLLAAALPHVGHIQTRNRGTIGGSLAHGDPTAEILLTAIALGARVTLASTAGARELDITDFSIGAMETSIREDECLAEVHFPKPPAGLSVGAAVDEISPRAGDYAVIGAAAEIGLTEDGTCKHIRLGVSGAAPVPVLCAPTMEALMGTRLADSDIDEAAHLITPLLSPESDVQASAAYRLRVAPGMLARATKAARDRAKTHQERGAGSGAT